MNHERAIEEASEKVELASDEKKWRERKEREARVLGILTREDKVVLEREPDEKELRRLRLLLLEEHIVATGRRKRTRGCIILSLSWRGLHRGFWTGTRIITGSEMLYTYLFRTS